MNKDALSRLTELRAGGGPAKPSRLRTMFTKELSVDFGVSGKEVAAFARQLATMVRAGLPVLRALETLREQTGSGRMRGIMARMCDDIGNGHSLSEALKNHRKTFGDFFIYMAEIGETGGDLAPMLERVATYLEKTGNLKRKITSALAYPALVVVVAAGAVTFLLTTVIPTFSSLFAGFDAELPGPTRVIITLSTLIKEHLLLVALAGAVSGAGGWYVLRRERVRYHVDRLVLRIPVLGTALRKNVIARFARSLGTLLNNGITITKALDITARTVGNRAVEELVLEMGDNVRQGQSLVRPLAESRIFTPMTVQMVTVGEESGKLGEMLVRTAEFHEAEVDSSVETLTSLIEPVIIIVLGVVLGAILIAMYLPMFELMEVIK